MCFKRSDGCVSEIQVHYRSNERSVEGRSAAGKVRSVSNVEATCESGLELEGENVKHSGCSAFAGAASNGLETSDFFDEELAMEPLLEPFMVGILLDLNRPVDEELMELVGTALLAIYCGLSGIWADPVVAFLAGVSGGTAYQDAVHQRSANTFAGMVGLDVELNDSSEA